MTRRRNPLSVPQKKAYQLARLSEKRFVAQLGRVYGKRARKMRSKSQDWSDPGLISAARVYQKLSDEALQALRRPNPGSAFVIYARRGTQGPLVWYDGKKLTNNDPPKYFGTQARAKVAARRLRQTYYRLLAPYRLYVGPPAARRTNPEIRPELDQAARKLEDFSGYPARKVLKVKTPRGGAGLVIGEIQHVSYIAQREGIAGSKPAEYEHAFSKRSRPLLAVTQDGKQLHIVGGRYEFTEAGIEDR